MGKLPEARSWMIVILLALSYTAAAQTAEGAISGEASQVTHPHSQPSLETGVSMVPYDLGVLQLARGMQLRFGVHDAPEMTTLLRVAANGTVLVPLAGPVYVAGMSLSEAGHAIESELVRGSYFVKPQVSLDVVQIAAGYLTVLGEVQSPGRFQILASIGLQEALAQAGGETAEAGATIEIHRAAAAEGVFEHASNARAGRSQFESVMVGPGDTVAVGRAGIVYVLGAVHRPGGYLMLNRGTLNVLEALALAQGTLLEAATGSIRILHRQGEHLMEEPFKLDPSTKGTTIPPLLHDTDIVYVPASKPKSILVNGAAILGAATSSIIYRVY